MGNEIDDDLSSDNDNGTYSYDSDIYIDSNSTDVNGTDVNGTHVNSNADADYYDYDNGTDMIDQETYYKYNTSSDCPECASNRFMHYAGN